MRDGGIAEPEGSVPVTPLDFGIALSLGLVSGLHCVQMCGPIALVIGGGRPLVLYNAGRIVTYLFLGMLAGTAGKALVFLGGTATVIAGGAMVAAGLTMIRIAPSGKLITIRSGGRFSKLTGGLLRAGRNKFLLGLALGFLPCGLVYAALLKAMHAAGPVAGALTMLAFGAGTSAALFAVGYGAAFCGRWMQRLAPLSVIVAGAMLVWRGLTGPHCHG
jgi:sulfite exporter TauE/SafE